jgi:hypothetical protein
MGGAAGETQRFDFVFERSSSHYVEELRTKLDAVQLGVLVCSAVISLFGAAAATFTVLEPRALALFGTAKRAAARPAAKAASGAAQQANPMHGETAEATARQVAALLKDVEALKATVAMHEHRLASADGTGAITQMAAI